MPRIFDNINLPLLSALQHTLGQSERADFCVGYFNLRGWRHLDRHIEDWPGGDGHCCRLLVGMQRRTRTNFGAALGIGTETDDEMDNARALEKKRELAREFRQQLMVGTPNDADEAGLRRLARQIKDGKLAVRLFLSHTLHAKLYLMFRDDPDNPRTGYVGSSNLTFSGLSDQGELNVDVVDHDAAQKLAKWFEDRWSDRGAWTSRRNSSRSSRKAGRGKARPAIPHLHQDGLPSLARGPCGVELSSGFPKSFGTSFSTIQSAAVKIAAQHLTSVAAC